MRIKGRGSIQAYPIAVNTDMGAQEVTYAVDEHDCEIESVHGRFWRITKERRLDGKPDRLVFDVPHSSAIVTWTEEPRPSELSILGALLARLADDAIERLNRAARAMKNPPQLSGFSVAEVSRGASFLEDLSSDDIGRSIFGREDENDAIAMTTAVAESRAKAKSDLPRFLCKNCQAPYSGPLGELEALLCFFRCGGSNEDLGEPCLVCGYPAKVHNEIGKSLKGGCSLAINAKTFDVPATRAGKKFILDGLAAWQKMLFGWPPLPAHVKRKRCRLCESYVNLHVGETVIMDQLCGIKNTALGRVSLSGEDSQAEVVPVAWTQNGLDWATKNLTIGLVLSADRLPTLD